jgi:Luciferase-like monooxygenase
MCQYGYEKEAKEIQDLYLGGNKRDAEALVPDDLLELGNLVGPASYVQERIAAFAEAGVTNLQVMPASDDPAGTVRRLKEMVA